MNSWPSTTSARKKKRCDKSKLISNAAAQKFLGAVAKDLQAMLRRLGYHVPATVGTGELAVQTALANRPDIGQMDWSSVRMFMVASVCGANKTVTWR